MSRNHHIRSEEYGDARRRREARATLALRLHHHLMEACEQCGLEWEMLAGDQAQIRARLRRAALQEGKAPDTPDHLLSLFSPEVRREEEELRRLREIRQEARVQSWRLQEVPPEERRGKVESARTRYRSRAVAEFLLDRCRDVIRNDPAEAESLAALVPVVLHWTPGAFGTPWAAELEALAAAWHANALRVAGDLPAADRAFVELRSALVGQPLQDPAVLGELRALEASLRIGQRRFAEAEALLDQAALLFQAAGDSLGSVKSLINAGNLRMSLGQPEEAHRFFSDAAVLLEDLPAEDYLRCATVTGRVTALCDLGRFAEAEALIGQHLDAYETSDDLHVGSMVRYLHGRIALGRGRHDEAERAFADCRDGYLAAGRTFDAVLACLDLAEVYLVSGRTHDLRQLARRLPPLFKARNVHRETLGALQLLCQSVVEEAVSQDLLEHLRRRLTGPEVVDRLEL